MGSSRPHASIAAETTQALVPQARNVLTCADDLAEVIGRAVLADWTRHVGPVSAPTGSNPRSARRTSARRGKPARASGSPRSQLRSAPGTRRQSHDPQYVTAAEASRYP